jgi:AraC-like DNA-binding protein
MRFVHRYASPTAGVVVDSPSLRHAEFAFRRTRYIRVIIDERLLTASFPLMRASSRLQVIVLLEGTLHLEHEGRIDHVAPGEAWLLGPSMQRGARFESATYLDLEWTTTRLHSVARPTRLKLPDPTSLRRIAVGIEGDGGSQTDVVRETFDLLKSLGAPAEVSRGALHGAPSDRDLRIARAMEAQLTSLGTKGTTLDLGEAAALSPRQLHRVIHDFNLRYSLNSGNWRDTRNRWRIQIAAVLLSLPELSVGSIAREVGYGTSASLARAFDGAGLLPPNKVRERLFAKQD